MTLDTCPCGYTPRELLVFALMVLAAVFLFAAVGSWSRRPHGGYHPRTRQGPPSPPPPGGTGKTRG